MSIAPWSGAQPPAAADVTYHAMQIVAEVEKTGGCDISLHGTPQLDELGGRWLVGYSGVGAACDEIGATLQREGMTAEIAFFRRPNGDEVKALIGRMRASVRRGFPCLISFKGEPQFAADFDRWSVPYYASGEQCAEASEELERQGKSLGIAFLRTR